MREDEQITYFAFADHRGKQKKFGIKALDRSKHVYVIGKTGMGKSVLLENMAAQDIQNGNGVAFIDPHGSAVEALLDYIPEERVKDVIYLAPFDMEYPISFNVMEDVGYDKRHLVVSGLISTFKKIWPDVWSARMEYILTNTLFALLEYPDSTLLDVNRMLINKEFRKDVVSHITDPVIKSFWAEEFVTYTDRYTQDATPAIQNKIGQFVSNPLIRNIIGQPKSSFDFRKAIDSRKIILINLSKGRIGDVNARLMGSMLIIKIYLAAMSRADTSPAELRKLPSFYFFVDEFQSFANETFADILSESRKYKLSLTLAHQYIFQMPEEVQKAVFGNIGTMILFRVGGEDAAALETEFMPVFTPEDLVSIGNYQIYLKLMIDGLASRPFSAKTLPPIEIPAKTFREEAIQYSREKYAQSRASVEEVIIKRHIPLPKVISKPKDSFQASPPRFEPRPQRPRESEASPPLRQEVERQGTGTLRGAPAVLTQTPSPRPPFRTEGIKEREPRRENSQEHFGGRPQPSMHRPFERVFPPKTIERQIPPPREEMKHIPVPKKEPVSLNSLLPQSVKQPRGESSNLQGLRSALQEALKKKDDVPEEARSQKTFQETTKEKVIPSREEREEAKIKEIPEKELRDMLKVETEKK